MISFFRSPTLSQLRHVELTHSLSQLHHHQCQLEFEQATVRMLIGRIDRLQDEIRHDQTQATATNQAQPTATTLPVDHTQGLRDDIACYATKAAAHAAAWPGSTS